MAAAQNTLKRILRPGLKRSASGTVIQDRRIGRVAKRSGALTNRVGPYANYQKAKPLASGSLRKKKLGG